MHRPRLLALEEAFTIPEIVEAASARVGGVPSMRSGPIAGPFMADLLDLGPGRVAGMDDAGVDVQFLSVAGPGVQHLEADQAVGLARLANDRLHELITAYPTRFVGMATLPTQRPAIAAAEVERTVRELGFKGVLINSHTEDRYLDDPEFWPILEAVEALGVPLYIHPRDPANSVAGAMVPGFTVGWAYAVETGTHALRLIASGVLDRFPELQIVLGHLGESIPLLLDRIDNRYDFEMSAVGGKPLPRKPGEYFREHFHVATSGMNFGIPVRTVIELLGADRVMFAADHPLEDQRAAVRAFEDIDLAPRERELISHVNAERLFGLEETGDPSPAE